MSTDTSPPVRALAPGGELRLPTPPGAVRRFWTRHPHAADALIAAIYVVPTVLTLVFNVLDAEPAPLNDVVLNTAITVTVAAALFFRRRVPRLVLAVTWIGLLTFADYGEVHLIAQLLALYAVAVYSDVRSAWIGFSASVLLAGVAAWLTDNPAEVSWIPVIIQVAIMMLAATLVGVNMGNSKRYVAALLDLAAQLARERDQQAQLARVSERARIAREMHDVVAHSLSVMVALADGAHAIALKDPDRSRAAMLEVAGTGRKSMHEMRRLLGVLAADTETDAARRPSSAARRSALAPQPGTEQLVELVESFRSADLPIRIEQNGRGPSNAGVQLTIYRIVQESLTNVLRYSDSPTLVTVRIVASATTVEVVVTDNGLLHDPGPSQGSGRGIIGLHERVALYGGTLEAGPAANRGWRVTGTMTFEPEEHR
ncbi:sensor histidine kinase [Cryobacterium sp. MLB-32]|uniref:sensor histidine kinase n=1 Tax=Cryobacterium sp. MLB-32 TaxID=1529318 RepID=UPI00069164EF|nr:histidine kinase [Cryobacterium sp. MLB-32]